MINRWLKISDCGMNTNSPGFVLKQQLRGYLVTPEHVLSCLFDVKKNSLWQLWDKSPGFLRPKGASGSGSSLWGNADIPGIGSSPCILQSVQKSETGKVSMVIEKSFLYKTFFLLCGSQVPGVNNQGRFQRSPS